MSKKLIAVAAAAALALTALVATPASATNISGVVIDDRATTAASSTTVIRPASAMVTRTLDYHSSSSTTRNVVRFVVTTTAATTVSVTSASGVLLADTLTAGTPAVARTIDSGTTAVSGSTTASALSYTFFAYTTNSVTSGNVVIATPGSTLTFVVGGVAAAAYNIVGAAFPTSIIAGQSETLSTGVISYRLTDVFGNAITTGTPAVLTALGATTSLTGTYSTVRTRWEHKVHSVGDTTTNVAMSLTLTATDLSDNGFAKPVTSAFSTVSSSSLADQVTVLTAANTSLTTANATLTTANATLTTQVATLTASVTSLTAQLKTAQDGITALTASTVTKQKYNELVRKWNRANPNNKVARVL